MGQRVLDLNVVHAEGLKDANLFTKMDVYVIVSIIGGSSSSIKQKTNIDHDSGTHPTWNFPMRFTFDELCALQGRSCLFFRLKCEGILSDSDIGQVHVPIKDLLNSSSTTNSAKYVHYQVTDTTGKGQGMLTFSYKFGEKMNESQTGEEPTQPLESYPNSHLYPYPTLHEPVLGSEYNYQHAPWPYTYPPEQVSASLYDYVTPRPSTSGPDCTYSSYQQPLQEVYPPPSLGGHLYPQWQAPTVYPPRSEPRYEYSGNGYMGYGYNN